MKKNDILKWFTHMVGEYIKCGFIFNEKYLNRMFYGFEAVVVLSNNFETIALYIANRYDSKLHTTAMTIAIDSYSFGINDKHSEICIGNDKDCVNLYSETYVQVKRGVSWYVSLEEATKAKELHYKRLRARETDSKLYKSDEAKELAVKILKDVPGFKRVKPEWVECIRRNHRKYCTDPEFTIITWTNFNGKNPRRRIVDVMVDSVYGQRFLVKHPQ